MKKIFVIWLAVVFFLGFASISDAQTNRKLKLTFKPLPDASQCRQKSGTAFVKVTFDKAGEIADARLHKSSGCLTFDGSAIKSALGIKFEPEIRNGEAVTVIKLVEYVYTKP